MFITLFQAEYTSPEFKNRILKPGDFVHIRNGIQYAVSEEIRLCDFIEQNEIKGVVQRITRRVDSENISARTLQVLPFPHTVIAEAKDLAHPITVEDVSAVKPGDIAFFWDGGFSDIIGSARTDSHGNNAIPCESGNFELAEIHKIVRAITQDTPEEKVRAQLAEEHSPRLTIAGENEHLLNVNAKGLYKAIKAEHQKSSQPDPINHPAHYGGQDNPYEAIKVIEAWNANFNIGNTLKYIARAGKKDNSIQDLQKAKWYLEREIQNLMNA